VKAESANYNGKPAVRVDALPDAANGASCAILKGSRFHNGTIEVELAGKPSANAGPGTRGFIGIAFRVQGNRFEYIYLRRRMGERMTRFAGTTRPSTPRTRNSISTGCGWNCRRYMNRTWTWSRGYVTKYRIVIGGTKAGCSSMGAAQPCLSDRQRYRFPPPLPSIFLMDDGHLTKIRGGKKGQIRQLIRFRFSLQPHG
jgi:hypothetical protein